MFICKTCVQKYEGSAVDWAKMGDFRSRGKCEMCEKGPKDCYDIPSSADWRLKKKGK